MNTGSKKAVQTFATCVRGNWSAESLHWLLNVVYREGHNKTLDKRAAFNLSALRKPCLHVLKILRIPKQDLSFRRKKRYISIHLEDSLSQFFGEINHTALINRGSNQFKTTQRDKKGAEIFMRMA